VPSTARGRLLVVGVVLIVLFVAATGTDITERRRMEDSLRAADRKKDEFIALFRKNHYPVLKKEVEMGRMLKVSAVAPFYHTTEDGRWDYRVTIVYKNATVAHDGYDSSALLKQLFPDQETYKKEEQRRFEILDAHWDLPLKDVDLDTK